MPCASASSVRDNEDQNELSRSDGVDSVPAVSASVFSRTTFVSPIDAREVGARRVGGGARRGDPPVVDQLFWAGYPCGYYLPSTVAPIGLANGLPVGIQIIGRLYDDLTCLHMAGLIEEGYCRFAPPPGY